MHNCRQLSIFIVVWLVILLMTMRPSMFTSVMQSLRGFISERHDYSSSSEYEVDPVDVPAEAMVALPIPVKTDQTLLK